MLAGFPPLRGPAELLLRAGPRATLELARVMLMPAQALAHELFRSPRARAWLHGSALHGDVPLAASGSAITAVYLHLLGHGFGWPSPKGGAGRLADALVGVLTELGGEVRCGQPVVRVVVERGRVAGVELRGRRAGRRPDRDRRRDAAPGSCTSSTCRTATPPRCAATATGRRR